MWFMDNPLCICIRAKTQNHHCRWLLSLFFKRFIHWKFIAVETAVPGLDGLSLNEWHVFVFKCWAVQCWEISETCYFSFVFVEMILWNELMYISNKKWIQLYFWVFKQNGKNLAEMRLWGFLCYYACRWKKSLHGHPTLEFYLSHDLMQMRIFP